MGASQRQYRRPPGEGSLEPRQKVTTLLGDFRQKATDTITRPAFNIPLCPVGGLKEEVSATRFYKNTCGMTLSPLTEKKLVQLVVFLIAEFTRSKNRSFKKSK